MSGYYRTNRLNVPEVFKKCPNIPCSRGFLFLNITKTTKSVSGNKATTCVCLFSQFSIIKNNKTPL